MIVKENSALLLASTLSTLSQLKSTEASQESYIDLKILSSYEY